MKKILALVLAITLLCSMLPVSAANTKPLTTAGDLNGDGATNSSDAIYLLYHTLFGSVRYPVEQEVDYDGNGTVSSADAIYLLYHTLFGEGRYPLGGAVAPKPESAFAIPVYSGSPYAILNDNLPQFSPSELTATGFEHYSELDALGRVGVATASCGLEIMPAPEDERGSISSVYPSGWVQASYDIVSGRYLYNRSHLIGWQLSAENANEKNLITGTRYFNTEGMLPFENMVADYVKETGNHVAYRVTPIYVGNNLVCSGVTMEAYSVEDNGEGICFYVYIFNVQPGIVIDYATGNSHLASDPGGSPAAPDTPPATDPLVYKTPTGKRYHLDPDCGGKNSMPVTLEEALNLGLTPCSKCVS